MANLSPEIENLDKRLAKKAFKKKRRSEHMLRRDTGINFSESPSKLSVLECTSILALQNVMLCNVGLLTGLQQEDVINVFQPFGTIDNIVMLPNKSYCFVVFQSISEARVAVETLHGRNEVCAEGPLYLAHVERVPEDETVWSYHSLPPGLTLHEDFVTEEEEEELLTCVDWNGSDPHLGQSLKHRKVKHYGYEFRYDNNNVDKNSPLSEGIPSKCSPILERMMSCDYFRSLPDQLTVNQYEPGQGIPPHVDTHSAFEDPIVSLSLGSSVIMDFKHADGRNIPVMLPKRSLLVMSGESRYDWTHGIVPRTMDVIPAAGGGLTVQKRQQRTSFTFRRVRRTPCDCKFVQNCDTYQYKLQHEPLQCDEKLAAKLETLHVHRVYEEIASHFSDTRHKPWPNVMEFVHSLPSGSLLVDVGCGNGKYFGFNKNIFEIGCDHSLNLMKVCKELGFEVFSCNCLSLPLRSGIADGCLSIAVIHHLATKERRMKALQEIVRILKSGGKALLYVWAKEQERNKKKSSYLKQAAKRKQQVPSETESHVCSVRKPERDQFSAPKLVGSTNALTSPVPCTTAKAEGTADVLKINMNAETGFENSVSLPVHVNRTNFLHQDLFVPWKLKPDAGKKVLDYEKQENKETPVFYRFYHVFEEGELDSLCNDMKTVKILRSYYDQGNWCILLEKL